jgi:hypothetical protein
LSGKDRWLDVRLPHIAVGKLLNHLARLVRCCDKPEVLGKLDPVNTAAILEVVARLL